MTRAALVIACLASMSCASGRGTGAEVGRAPTGAGAGGAPVRPGSADAAVVDAGSGEAWPADAGVVAVEPPADAAAPAAPRGDPAAVDLAAYGLDPASRPPPTAPVVPTWAERRVLATLDRLAHQHAAGWRSRRALRRLGRRLATASDRSTYAPADVDIASLVLSEPARDQLAVHVRAPITAGVLAAQFGPFERVWALDARGEPVAYRSPPVATGRAGAVRLVVIYADPPADLAQAPTSVVYLRR